MFLGDGNDDPLTCDSVSTCPTLTDGLNGLGASFDGVNDYIPLHIGSNLHDQSITLDIKLDQLPSAGNVAQLLSTDSSAARASQIYINSAGNIVADRGGDTHTSDFSFAGNLGIWKNVQVLYSSQTSRGVGGYRSEFKIDGPGQRVR